MTSVPPRVSTAPPPTGPSEFDILKQNHRFLREDEHDESTGSSSWNEGLARKFYDNLWKEYALCDLKHYKSGNFALRWRTEEEVVAGTGETSCANTRCKRHEAPQAPQAPSSSAVSRKKRRDKDKPSLNTLELPFGYVEGGQVKSALVKVVLCDKCVRKIMWKREQEKKAAAIAAGETVEEREDVPSDSNSEDNRKGNELTRKEEGEKSPTKSSSQKERKAESRHRDEHKRRRHSRSQSPTRRGKGRDERM